MKYVDKCITFSEIPDEITLCINISNCPFECDGCHSPYLRDDVGTKFTFSNVIRDCKCNYGISCVCFMGGDSSPRDIDVCGEIVKANNLKSAWYSGADELSKDIHLANWDYIKLGHYDKDKGGLDKYTTNQRLYKIEDGKMIDITYKFWKDGKLK